MKEKPQADLKENKTADKENPKLPATKSVLLEDKNWQAMREKMALAVRSGLLPKEMTYEKAVMIAAYGRELQLNPMTAVKEIYIVDGKPSMSASLMKALVHRKLPNALFKVTESTKDKCVIVTKRMKDDANEPQATWTFTIEEAKAFYSGRNGIKDNWKKHPADMLRARCISRACRGEFSDVFLGPVYTPEEIEILKEAVDSGNKQQKILESFNEHYKNLGEESQEDTFNAEEENQSKQEVKKQTIIIEAQRAGNGVKGTN